MFDRITLFFAMLKIKKKLRKTVDTSEKYYGKKLNKELISMSETVTTFLTRHQRRKVQLLQKAREDKDEKMQLSLLSFIIALDVELIANIYKVSPKKQRHFYQKIGKIITDNDKISSEDITKITKDEIMNLVNDESPKRPSYFG